MEGKISVLTRVSFPRLKPAFRELACLVLTVVRFLAGRLTADAFFQFIEWLGSGACGAPFCAILSPLRGSSLVT